MIFHYPSLVIPFLKFANIRYNALTQQIFTLPFQHETEVENKHFDSVTINNLQNTITVT